MKLPLGHTRCPWTWRPMGFNWKQCSTSTRKHVKVFYGGPCLLQVWCQYVTGECFPVLSFGRYLPLWCQYCHRWTVTVWGHTIPGVTHLGSSSIRSWYYLCSRWCLFGWRGGGAMSPLWQMFNSPVTLTMLSAYTSHFDAINAIRCHACPQYYERLIHSDQHDVLP